MCQGSIDTSREGYCFPISNSKYTLHPSQPQDGAEVDGPSDGRELAQPPREDAFHHRVLVP